MHELLFFKCSWENAVLPGAFENKKLRNICGGANMEDWKIQNTIRDPLYFFVIAWTGLFGMHVAYPSLFAFISQRDGITRDTRLSERR